MHYTKHSISRKRKTQVLIAVILTLLFVTGGSIYHKGEATEQSETVEELKILSEVLYLIMTNYVEEVDVTSVIYGGIHEMMRTVDPHGSFMPPDVYQGMQVETRGGYGGLGIQIAIKDDQLIVSAPIDDTPAFRAGIEAGDKIIKIDGTSTKDMSLMEAVKLMRGPKGTSITITIMRDSFREPKDFTIVRDIIKTKSVFPRMLNDNIGYIYLRLFHEDSADELEDALNELEQRGMKGLVLDLRDNGGGLLNSVVEVADKFLEKGKLIVSTEGRKKNQDKQFVARQEFTHPNYPLIVLVNKGTISGSEIMVSALQAHKRALILGSQTFGRVTIQSVIPLSDGAGLRLTTSQYYNPDGHLLQKGITPDIVMELPGSESPVRFGDLSSDVQLQRALNILKFQIAY